MFVLLLVVVGLWIVDAAGFRNDTTYSVLCHSELSSCVLKRGMQPHTAAVFGKFRNSIHATGWDELWITSQPSHWYEAGFLEGALTAQQIFHHYHSWYTTMFPTDRPLQDSTKHFILEQYRYAQDLVLNRAKDHHHEYYQVLGDLLQQFQGLLAGINYAAQPGQSLTLLELLLLQAAGDLYDIVPATTTTPLQFQSMTDWQTFYDTWHHAISCSALVRVTKENVFVGHTTWSTYQNMLRMYKHVRLDRYQTSFSSKPGLLYSKDDFYVLPVQELVVMETTNGILSSHLLKKISPRSLLTWQRVPVANRLAHDGESWTAWFSLHNSGTYANQWIVVDLKRFNKHTGLVWIAESAPGLLERRDVSKTTLKMGYWASYNVPYFQSVFNASGFVQAEQLHGQEYSYANCSRARIFARDAPHIQTFQEFKQEMRLNRFATDSLSQGNPDFAISSRSDLRPLLGKSRRAFGGIDSKVTSLERVKLGVAEAQNGPTWDDQPPFRWSTSEFNNLVHWGQPDLFQFPFVEMKSFPVVKDPPILQQQQHEDIVMVF